ncbi:hypothetical protein ACPCT8_05975, partial [Aeromonas media]
MAAHLSCVAGHCSKKPGPGAARSFAARIFHLGIGGDPFFSPYHSADPVSFTKLPAPETGDYLACPLLLEKKKKTSSEYEE